MKIIFKIILMITIIFFSNEQTVCASDSYCSYAKREGKCDTTTSFCLCADGYTRDDTGNCTKSVGFGETCNLFAELCKEDNQACSYEQKCACKSGYIYSNTTKTCKKIIEYGETCDEDICDSNLICKTDSTCGCSEGYTYDESSNKCIKVVNYGETCDDEYIICESNQICGNNLKCECSEGYTYDETNSKCIKKGTYGESCEDDSVICESNLICGNSYVCECSEEYTYSYTESKCIEYSEEEDDNSKFIGFNVLFFFYIFLFF